MTELSERLLEKYFGDTEHPYKTFEHLVNEYLHPDSTLLDAGCGRTAPVLQKYRQKAARLIGIDLVDFEPGIVGIELINSDLSEVDLQENSVDLFMSRSVIVDVVYPLAVYKDMSRLLRPGGRFVFLSANLWDYASLVARVVPSRLHPWLVARVEGRKEHDDFPIQYKSNTRGAVSRLAKNAGLEVESFRYLGQYPCYFMFNGFLFFIATGYEKLISRFDSLAFLRGWILVVLSKPWPDQD